MLEIKLNVAAANIRCHGDYRSSVNPSNYTASGNAIKIRHNDIHQDEIVFRTFWYFINGFEAIELELC